MLDALVPASDALAASLRSGRSPSAALAEAAAAAERGAEATASLPPRRGRSSYLGDRALGHPDPGRRGRRHLAPRPRAGLLIEGRRAHPTPVP